MPWVCTMFWADCRSMPTTLGMAKATKAAVDGAGVVTTGVGAAAADEAPAGGRAVELVLGELLLPVAAGPQAVSAARAPAAVMSTTVRRMRSPDVVWKQTGP